MRTPTEVINEILAFANRFESIRAVIMNGSRVNPHAPQDLFCDYDIVFAVEDPPSFMADQSWISNFGDVIIMQAHMMEENGLEWPICMIIFTDNVRLDLQFFPIEHIEHKYQDSLSRLLLDKDGTIAPFPPSNDYTYYTKKPSVEHFAKTINEFFWVATYVGKGIWRDELSYAQHLYHSIVVKALNEVVAWHIGYDHNWQINSGKLGKWYHQYLPESIWCEFARIFNTGTYPDFWNSLFRAIDLMNTLGAALGQNLGYPYPHKEAKMVCKYLKRIQELPPNALEFGPDITI